MSQATCNTTFHLKASDEWLRVVVRVDRWEHCACDLLLSMWLGREEADGDVPLAQLEVSYDARIGHCQRRESDGRGMSPLSRIIVSSVFEVFATSLKAMAVASPLCGGGTLTTEMLRDVARECSAQSLVDILTVNAEDGDLVWRSDAPLSPPPAHSAPSVRRSTRNRQKK